MDASKMQELVMVADATCTTVGALELALRVAGEAPHHKAGDVAGAALGLEMGASGKVYGGYAGGLATLLRYAGRKAGLYPSDIAQALVEDEALGLIATDNLAMLESDFGIGPYLLGDKLTIADVALAGLPKKALDAFPHLKMAAETAKTEKVVKHHLAN